MRCVITKSGATGAREDGVGWLLCLEGCNSFLDARSLGRKQELAFSSSSKPLVRSDEPRVCSDAFAVVACVFHRSTPRQRRPRSPVRLLLLYGENQSKVYGEAGYCRYNSAVSLGRYLEGSLEVRV